MSELEDILDEVSDDVSEIVEVIGEEVSEIEGISEIADEVDDILEEELADAPLDEVEEAIDQVVNELDELVGHEPEVVADVGESAVSVSEDTSSPEVAVVSDVDVIQSDVAEDVDVAEQEAAQVDPTIGNTAEELADDVLVAPTEGVGQGGLMVDNEQVDESVDLVDQSGESQLVEEGVNQETEQEDDREYVWSFGRDSVESFFDSLSQAHEEFQDQHQRRGFGGWVRGLWRALRRA